MTPVDRLITTFMSTKVIFPDQFRLAGPQVTAARHRRWWSSTQAIRTPGQANLPCMWSTSAHLPAFNTAATSASNPSVILRAHPLQRRKQQDPRSGSKTSIGVNWQSPNSDTGVTNFQSDLQTLFVKFDDSCSLSGPKSTWYNSAAPTSLFVDSDPIGFTDPATGRVFAGELTLTSPSCKVSFTDTDGLDGLGQPSQLGWSPSSGPLGSGIDHETIGGGPFHAPIPPLPGPYPHAVYYCS